MFKVVFPIILLLLVACSTDSEKQEEPPVDYGLKTVQIDSLFSVQIDSVFLKSLDFNEKNAVLYNQIGKERELYIAWSELENASENLERKWLLGKTVLEQSQQDSWKEIQYRELSNAPIKQAYNATKRLNHCTYFISLSHLKGDTLFPSGKVEEILGEKR